MSVELLPSHVWQYIALILGAADRIRFGAVSKTWKSLLPSRHPPWLLLADSQENEGRYEPEPESEDESDEEEQHNEDEPPPPLLLPLLKEEEDHEHEEEPQRLPAPRRGFVCLGEDKIYDFNLPQLYETTCIGSTGSWLITLHRDDTIRLLNPFSKQQLFLPGICSFEHDVKNRLFRSPYLRKIVLSSSSPSTPSGQRRDCIAMAIHGPKKILAMARLGDSNWTTLQRPALGSHLVEDLIFYKGQFYAITRRDWLLVCDLVDDDNPKAAVICRRDVGTPTVWRMNYLVECLGELLLVIKWINESSDIITDYSTRSFQVYKFNFMDGEWNEVQSLGEHSLFLGFNTSVSVRASEYCGIVRQNCIYFTDDFLAGYGGVYKTGHDMGVFDLEHKSIRPHYRGVSTSRYSTPVWIVPSPN